VLNWEIRKEIILGEILAQDPDVICLQELDKFNYDEFFRMKLAEAGYKGYFAQKSRYETLTAAVHFTRRRNTSYSIHSR
jgi:CCR4-NOT transcription complex subunit 6